MLKPLVDGVVYVFVDAANIFYCQKTLGWRISYKKLMDYLKEECDLGQCFVYTGVKKSHDRQENFLNKLKECQYIVETKPLKRIFEKDRGTKLKANLDVELAFDMDDLSIKYDTAVLLSGDSDFVYPIKRIKRKNKRVIVMSTKGHIARELLKEAKYIDLKKLKSKLILER